MACCAGWPAPCPAEMAGWPALSRQLYGPKITPRPIKKMRAGGQARRTQPVLPPLIIRYMCTYETSTRHIFT